MRKPKISLAAAADYNCSAAAVWQMLTTEECYRDWFGYPDTEELVFVDPSFSAGAKLHFKGFSSSMVVTRFRVNRELTFADSAAEVRFFMELRDRGCNVTLTLNLYTLPEENRFPGERYRDFCREVLARLGDALAAAADLPPETGADNFDLRMRPGEFLQRVFTGYRRPVASVSAADEDLIYGALIDRTEAAVTFSRGALAAALLLAVMFFTTIGVSLSFERSDIVPSSGLSLFESENVTKENALLIRLGEKKQDLELRLSCQGQRLTTELYLYSSSVRDAAGIAAEQIYVLYDAYGEARGYVYLNTLLAKSRIPRTARGTPPHYSYRDMNAFLSPDTDIYAAEAAAGLPVSAYIVDKSGAATAYFGEYHPGDNPFSSHYKSEITVTLNRRAGYSSTEYFYAIGEDNPWPLETLSLNLKRQYAELEEYLGDRFAFERAVLLVGATWEETGILLGTEGSLYSAEAETGVETYYYSRRAPSAEDPGNRYTYFVTFREGRAAEVRFANTKISEPASDTLLELPVDLLRVGMEYGEAVELIGILPAAVFADADRLTLRFGGEMEAADTGETEETGEAEETADAADEYPLSVTFRRSTGRISEIVRQTPESLSQNSGEAR